MEEHEGPFEPQRCAALLVDCDPEMFTDDAFKIVVEACFQYYDKMLNKRSGKNHLTILLVNNDIDKQVLISNTITALEAYRALHPMLQLTTDDLKAKYASKSASFAPHLLRAVKIVEQFDMVMYATCRSDPCTDDGDRRQAMLNFDTLKVMHARFKVLALRNTVDFSEFYDEVYKLLEQKTFNYYYKVQSLAPEIADSVHYKERVYGVNLYPYPGCPNPLRVEQYKVLETKWGRTKVKIHKETLEILEKRTLPQEKPRGFRHFVRLSVNGVSKMPITPEQYKELFTIKGIEMGITLIEARPQKSGAYSINGVGCHSVQIIRASHQSTDMFINFWEAVKDLHLLCYWKLTRAGTCYTVEMTPVIIGKQKCFEVRFIPPLRNVYLPIGFDPYHEVDIDLDFRKHSNLPRLEELIEECSIEDVDSFILDLCAPKKAKIREYAKQQLLGNTYIRKELKSCANMCMFKGKPEKIKEICDAMEAASMQDTGTKRRRK